MTDGTYTPEQFAETRIQAEALMETCKADAQARWRARLAEHRSPDTETDEAGQAVGEIANAVVIDLADHEVYLLASLPEVWEDPQVDEPGDAWPDQTLRGAVRLAIASKLDAYLEARTSVQA